MQTILTQEELDALVAQCKMMQASGECYLTFNQGYWLYDIVDNCENQRYAYISDKAVRFMFQIANGDYKECF